MFEFSQPFDVAQLKRVFAEQGVVILRGFAAPEQVAEIRAEAMAALDKREAPFELEASLAYPGAPESVAAQGGQTIRRLRGMVARSPIFRQWATHPRLLALLRPLLGERITLTQVHHNSLMTKQPSFSSDTLWHRDLRYWRFSRPQLVSCWLALGDENPENGGLGFIPASHNLTLPETAFDSREFLLADHPVAAPWIAKAQFPRLSAGDVVLFDARTFHAASRNSTEKTKYSLVMSYHASDNLPLENSRSATEPGVDC
ncbi:phytanoyl-CoA dioxygenase family protein [Deefgea piscis]|uniref:Phytanoyl-CoA dioxygenase family protein n=1 Tax=Deefgea piscis TaxID=2739061 RepID=A0A6M8SK72_9NEIS|nr:phytanoyl-CoA dioxygenase family protein [Deefgea piscis]QKJ65493.1 phytanoyl-CoA dioxygenase family protein [Deefgea piscis]